MIRVQACTGLLALLVVCAYSSLAMAGSCLDGSTPVQCLIAPCDTQECKDKCAAQGDNSQCVNNYCGGCNCDCVPKGRVLNTASSPMPVDIGGCLDGSTPVNCVMSPCSTPQCKDKCAAMGKDTKCVDNYCGGCNCDCVPKAPAPLPQLPSGPTCPNGKPLVQCFVEPCSTDKCKKKCAALGLVDKKHDYKCVDNYCGGCNCDCVPQPKPTTAPICPAGQPVARCFAAPCSTDACKNKCAAAVPKGFSVEVKCLDNYCGGCNCDCCLARDNICSTSGPLKDLSCCPGNICAFSNACIVNPFAKCGTVCIPKEESADFCKKEYKQCDPKKLQCCSGTSCQRWGKHKSKQYKCQKCKPANAKCSLSKQDCCAYLSCQKKSGAKYATCQPAHMG